MLDALKPALNGSGQLNVPGRVCVVGSTAGHCWRVVRALPLSQPEFILVGPSGVKSVSKSKWCIQYVESELSSENGIPPELAALQPSFDNLILVPADVSGVKVVALANDGFLKFPVSNVSTVARLNDKYEFFSLCKELGIETPETKLFKTKLALFEEWPNIELQCPFVVKPTNREDGEGVCIITSEDYYRKNILDEDYGFAPLLAQRYIPGHDIDISILSLDGIILHYAVQTYINGKLWFIQSKEILNHARKIVWALRFSGILHIDGRIDSETGEINLIEGNPRIWSSMNALTLMDLNFVRAGIELILTGRTSAAKTVTGESLSLSQVAVKGFCGGNLSREQRLVLKNTFLDPLLVLRRLIWGDV